VNARPEKDHAPTHARSGRRVEAGHPRNGPRDESPAITGKPIRPDGPEAIFPERRARRPTPMDPGHPPDGPPELAAIL